MDIAGPKLRTGPFDARAAVLKIKPRRDALGHVVRPALVALVAASHGRSVPLPVDAVLPLDGDPPSA